MLVVYEIRRGALVAILNGEFDVEESARGLDAATSAGEFRPGMRLLLDLRRVSGLRSAGQLGELAKQAECLRERVGELGILAGEAQGEIVSQFGAGAGPLGLHTRVFREIGEAHEWAFAPREPGGGGDVKAKAKRRRPDRPRPRRESDAR